MKKHLVVGGGIIAAALLSALILTMTSPKDESFANKPEDPPEGGLYIYTVYNNPRDHPGYYVIRRWLVTAGKVRDAGLFAKNKTLDGVRAALPAGLTCLGRDMMIAKGLMAIDDYSIVESWL